MTWTLPKAGAVVDLQEAEAALGVAARAHPALQHAFPADRFRAPRLRHADLFHRRLLPGLSFQANGRCVSPAGASESRRRRHFVHQRWLTPAVRADRSCPPRPPAVTMREWQRPLPHARRKEIRRVFLEPNRSSPWRPRRAWSVAPPSRRPSRPRNRSPSGSRSSATTISPCARRRRGNSIEAGQAAEAALQEAAARRRRRGGPPGQRHPRQVQVGPLPGRAQGRRRSGQPLPGRRPQRQAGRHPGTARRRAVRLPHAAQDRRRRGGSGRCAAPSYGQSSRRSDAHGPADARSRRNTTRWNRCSTCSSPTTPEQGVEDYAAYWMMRGTLDEHIAHFKAMAAKGPDAEKNVGDRRPPLPRQGRPGRRPRGRRQGGPAGAGGRPAVRGRRLEGAGRPARPHAEQRPL